MKFRIVAIDNFKREAKRLLKKYPSLKYELIDLETNLLNKPDLGIPIGHNCYKIRLAIKSKGQGKFGGARIITNVVVIESTIFLLTIYDKADMDNISDTELKRLLKELPE